MSSQEHSSGAISNGAFTIRDTERGLRTICRAGTRLGGTPPPPWPRLFITLRVPFNHPRPPVPSEAAPLTQPRGTQRPPPPRSPRQPAARLAPRARHSWVPALPFDLLAASQPSARCRGHTKPLVILRNMSGEPVMSPSQNEHRARGLRLPLSLRSLPGHPHLGSPSDPQQPGVASVTPSLCTAGICWSVFLPA